MNERSAGLLLQLMFATNLISAQIQFPDDSNADYVPINIPRTQKLPIRDQQNEENIIAHGITKLTLDINRVTSSISSQIAHADNVVYGPVTIAGALAVVLLAAIGQTFTEIATTLGLSQGFNIENKPLKVHEHIGKLASKLENNSGIEVGHRVTFATAIFVQNDFPIRPEFEKAAQTYYNSNIMNLDFQRNSATAQRAINAWISNRTNGKIRTLLADAPPPSTKAIIASVLYFKAAWEFPFFDGHTRRKPFYTNGRKSPSHRVVEMMNNGGEFPYFKDLNLNVDIMGFPYKGFKTTMYVVIPHNSNADALKRLENTITADDIDRLVSKTRYVEAVIAFPKMKLESTMDLRGTLQNLGINSLFNPYLSNLALLSGGVNQRFRDAEASFVNTPPVATGFKRQSFPSQGPPFVSDPIPSNFQQPPSTPPPFLSNPLYNLPTQPPPTPRRKEENLEERLVFARFGEHPTNCLTYFDYIRNVTRCVDSLQNLLRTKRDTSNLDSLNRIRQQLSQNPSNSNPGIYADQIIHKVYIDITESGTEAASATGVSLNRSGGRVTFRADVPFLFFIYHEETKVILFWGSVKTPSPNFAAPNH